MSVTLFSMIHIGEPQFFEQVYRDAFQHDVALVEGVRSPIVKNITRSYRWAEGARLGLVVQPRFPVAGSVPAQIIHADLSTEEFHREWRKIPLWLRAAIYIVAPVVGLGRRFARTREAVARRAEMEDRLSSEEILSWDPRFGALQHSILHARDARLLERLSEVLDAPDRENLSLAIVYGAGHMRAVLAELKRRGFRCVDSGWYTAFHFDA